MNSADTALCKATTAATRAFVGTILRNGHLATKITTLFGICLCLDVVIMLPALREPHSNTLDTR